MTKSNKTERQLFDALDRLVSGEPRKSDGRITQENIAIETGVSRATFNRYPKVVEEYRKVKLRGTSSGEPRPFTIEDKNRELQESNILFRKQLTQGKLEYGKQLASARQEIFILNMALKDREIRLAEKDREIIELKRRISSSKPGAVKWLGLAGNNKDQ